MTIDIKGAWCYNYNERICGIRITYTFKNEKWGKEENCKMKKRYFSPVILVSQFNDDVITMSDGYTDDPFGGWSGVML